MTRAGVEAWIEKEIGHRYRYDQVRDPLDGRMKYRCLYEKDGADVPFVLVNDHKNGDGRVILFEQEPDAQPVGLQRGLPEHAGGRPVAGWPSGKPAVLNLTQTKSTALANT